jgi:hypothetical protein
MSKQMTFVAAMRDYFGFNRGGEKGTTSSFLAELKALTDDDKAWFRKNLETVGYEITNATGSS